MTGIWGWLGGTPADGPGWLSALGGGAGAGDRRIADGAAVAGADGELVVGRLSGLLIACAGGPGLAEDGGETPVTLAELAAAYRRAGPELPGRLAGPFALAVLEPDTGRGLLAVDRMGVFDLAYAHTGGALLFGPRADALAADPRCRAEIDPQALYDYVHFHMIPRPDTAYRGVRRLLPGESLVLGPEGPRPRRYWLPSFQDAGRTPLGELEEEFCSGLRAAVARRARRGPVGTFLSGGTDSSTLTGLLGEITGEAPRAYSIGFDTPGYDELEYARIAARRFGARHREYIVTPADVAAAIPRIAAGFDQPYGNASAVPTYYCARLAAEDGITALIGGDGGDELFAGNARYAKQWVLSLYERIPAALRGGLIEPALHHLPGAGGIPPLRKLRNYVRQAALPVPERLQAYNLLAFLGPERVFTDDFLERVDTTRPLEMSRREYSLYRDFHPTNRLLALDMKFTLADDDLRKVCGASALAGVEARFPFLDEAVVALAARVPPGQKLRGTRLRHFFKRALRDYLPPETLAKEKHGFGLPFGVWLRQDPALRELAGDSLQTLRNREVIRSGIIDDLTGPRMDEHAAYFGTLVWVLMMLEQWYQTRTATTVPKPATVD